MGSDDLFHKRRERKASSLRRRKSIRAPYDVVLIVCEGKKTEPYYFMELRENLRLNNANIIISDEGHGTDPLSLVKYAISCAKRDGDYDHVFCVFDRDQHATYQPALEKVKTAHLPGKGKLHAITSIPCFEFWLLLHFRYSTKGYVAGTGSTLSEQVIRDLKKYLPDYRKGDRGLFGKIRDKLVTAIENARRVLVQQQSAGTDDPSTHVHELVQFLLQLEQEQRKTDGGS
jgi:hypothetical protein